MTDNNNAIAERLHIVRIQGQFHVVEIPTADGEPFRHWYGPFERKLAAEIFLPDFIRAHEAGHQQDACHLPDFYDIAARALKIIKAHDGDDRELAMEIVRTMPWGTQSDRRTNMDPNIPF